MVRGISRYTKLIHRSTFALAIIIPLVFFFRFQKWFPSTSSSHVHTTGPPTEKRRFGSKIRDDFVASSYHFRSRFAIPASWTGALKDIFPLTTSDQISDETPIERRNPPNIKLTMSDSPPALGSQMKNQPIEKAYNKALKDIDDAVRLLIAHDPVISSPEFRNRTTGVPGTAIATDVERQTLQKWLDCTSNQGEWRWEPLANATTLRPLTVHKQGPLEAKCDRSYAQLRERGGENVAADGWDVRPSLKFRWYPSNRCQSLRPRQLKQDVRLSRRDLCRMLRHKNILIVGDVAQYAMHDVLLDWTSTKPITCYGDLYCKEHGICGGELKANWNGSDNKLESGALDDYVYEQLPPQPNITSLIKRSSEPHQILSKFDLKLESEAGSLNVSSSIPSDKKAPRKNTKVSSNQSITPPRGTVLRFRRSDSLWASSSPSHRRFAPVWQHGNTGVRDVNNCTRMYKKSDLELLESTNHHLHPTDWITDSRRSDVVVLSRPPLPLPLPSHRHKAFTMTTEIPAPHLQYLRHVSANKSCPSPEFFESGGVAAAATLIEMARRMVLEVWLPELLYSLLSLRSTASPPDQLMVWRGEWRLQTGCGVGKVDSTTDSTSRFDWKSWWYKRAAQGDGPPPHPSAPTLFSIMFSELADQLHDQKTDRLTAPRRKALDKQLHVKDSRTVFHNLQVIFQNQLMRQLAPIFGIPYLDLEGLTSVWRSGMVGGSTPSSPSTPSSMLSSQRRYSIFDSFRTSPTKGQPASSSNGKDCLHYCFPSPGMAVEEGFIGGLLKVFYAGWESQPERDSWIGDSFVPVREREANRRAT